MSLDPDVRKTKRRKITNFINVHNCTPVKGVDYSGRKEQCDNYRSQVVCPGAAGKKKETKTVSVCIPLFENKSTGEKHVLRVLFDSGSDGDILFLTKKSMKDLPWDLVNLAYPVTWGTSNGSFKTTRRAKAQLLLPEFSQSKIFEIEPDVKVVKGGEAQRMTLLSECRRWHAGIQSWILESRR